MDSGRVREQQRSYWSKLIAEQEASGQKARPFCRERGIGDIFSTSGAGGCGSPTPSSSHSWSQNRRRPPVQTPSSSWSCGTANGCALPTALMRPRFAWCWMLCGHDAPAGQCQGLSLPESVRHAAKFHGLHALVRDHLDLDPFAGHLYLFANKRKDRLKILYWDWDGFAIWAKRLEAGTYAIPSGEPGSTRFEITVEELAALLSGIDLSSADRRNGTAAWPHRNISIRLCCHLETALFPLILIARWCCLSIQTICRKTSICCIRSSSSRASA